ncbi:MAG: phosphatase PAP2 family protein [Chloroflexi bacterium]|nr:phosphatase PAP2 family protein [Chloroflexota bacterium]
MSTTPDETQVRVRQVLQEQLAQIDSPEAAQAVVAEVEQLTAGEKAGQKCDEAAAKPTPAQVEVERAAQSGPPPHQAAAALAEATAQAGAPTPEAPAVEKAVRQTVGARPQDPAPPEVERGRELLRRAVFDRMGPFERLDAFVFVKINNLPHPRWLDRMANTVSIVTTGGWIWGIGVYVAGLSGVPRTNRALKELMPSLIAATWIIERWVKAIFRRKRPFIDIIRAVVVGRKPGSWSFPSGHTASSFAGAWMVSCVWPRWAPLYFALASIVGFSRVYVGAHYPGDVLSGAATGLALAETTRRLTRLALSARWLWRLLR